MKKIAVLLVCTIIILICVAIRLKDSESELPIVNISGDSGETSGDGGYEWVRNPVYDMYYGLYSGDTTESSGDKLPEELVNSLNEYKNYIDYNGTGDYENPFFGFLELDETNIPFLYDGHRFYHYENDKVKFVEGYVNDRDDRTTKYYIKNKPFILDVFNYGGLQSYTIYQFESGSFKKVFESDEYIVNEEDLFEVDASEYKKLEGINEKELDYLINQALGTKNYSEEYTEYIGLDSNIYIAISNYRKELKKNL